MQNRRKVFLQLITIGIIMAACTACTGSALNPETALWGQWNFAGGVGSNLVYAIDLQFHEDGSLTLFGRPHLSITYVIIAPGRIKFSEGGVSEVLNYSLEEDKLTFYFEDGQYTYTRASETRPIAQGEPVQASTTMLQDDILEIIDQEIDEDELDESADIQIFVPDTASAPTQEIPTTTPPIGSTATETPPIPIISIDPSDPQAILDWVRQAIDVGDASLIEDLVSEGGVWYNDRKMDSSGFVLKTRQAFIQDLQLNLATRPVCEGVLFDGQVLVIWYKNWKPGWEPSLMDPRNAGFLFTKEAGVLKLTDLLIYTPVHYFNYAPAAPRIIYSLIACDSKDINNPNFVPSCPGSLPQRLQVGDRGRVCTQKDSVRLRVRPGIEGAVRLVVSPDTTFEVIDGPECAGSNWSWWQVQLDDGQVGWMAEGGDEEDIYFLCPLD